MAENQELYARIDTGIALGKQYTQEIEQLASSFQRDMTQLQRDLAVSRIDAAIARGKQYSSQIEQIALSLKKDFGAFSQTLEEYRNSQVQSLKKNNFQF